MFWLEGWSRLGGAVERTRSSTVAEHDPLIYRRTCSWEMLMTTMMTVPFVSHATHSRSLGGNYIPSMLFHRIPSGARAERACALVCCCVRVCGAKASENTVEVLFYPHHFACTCAVREKTGAHACRVPCEA
ncbi:unspecified product [Leptomonas pyrrhocoris]|uniref:Unspecified product n=1 Tax=Leptomonas pyrrhocoris TaxID=157538 RepID=A0A0M9FXT9_LEPPY|nr:unspecified product [Leptomonas pyrrhocoris]KPA78320.1 unspecified product [Leptomonas pyrrhocoris]|eukprot:XP_015656759.1 unspecified product [Leptomonas pyrrhocoris]